MTPWAYLNVSHVSTRLPPQSCQAHPCNLGGCGLLVNQPAFSHPRLTVSFHPRSLILLCPCLGLSQEISHASSYYGLLLVSDGINVYHFLFIYAFCTVLGYRIIFAYTVFNVYLMEFFLKAGTNWVGGMYSRFVSVDLASGLNLPSFFSVSLRGVT